MTDDLITAVERSKKGAVVTLNGEEKIFVSRALLIEREFAEGQALQRDELAQWLLPRQYPEALNLAVSLLASGRAAPVRFRKSCGTNFICPRPSKWCSTSWKKNIFSTTRPSPWNMRPP